MTKSLCRHKRASFMITALSIRSWKTEKISANSRLVTSKPNWAKLSPKKANSWLSRPFLSGSFLVFLSHQLFVENLLHPISKPWSRNFEVLQQQIQPERRHWANRFCPFMKWFMWLNNKLSYYFAVYYAVPLKTNK